MTPATLQTTLRTLLDLPAETEWVEFKEAKETFDFNKLGEYFSALSNEANLKGQQCGWLVFGVSSGFPRATKGSNYRRDRSSLDKLKHEIGQGTNNRTTFSEIYELNTADGRVVLFEIPPALRGVPTSWKGHFFGRDGESLVPLGLHKIEQIRRQVEREDWSVHLCDDATLNDLDPEAINVARREYKSKHSMWASEVDQWNDHTFLNKAKLCIKGRLTRAAIILLGRDEAEHYLSPGIARITWVTHRDTDDDPDYQHFGPPLMLAVDKVFAKIRNRTYRYLANRSLFPTEISQYDPWVIRETLHNCIAHQDYSRGGKINVVEESDSLLFTNLGEFLPGSVEQVIVEDAPPELYVNRFLAEAMVNLNMIDTIGSGIKRMFRRQRERNFPMPDYDLTDPGRVKVRIIGGVIDEKYTRMLMALDNLDLMDVVALDKVQKGKPLTNHELKSLRRKKLVEGRRPNLFVSANVAADTDTLVDYLKRRGIDKQYSRRMVVELLECQGQASRSDIDKLLANKLSDALDEEQKRNSITNLLQEMRRDNTIQPVAGKRGRGAKWELCKPDPEGSG